jgi:hypothetical protein
MGSALGYDRFGSCHAAAVTATAHVDPTVPPPGETFVYLITGVAAGGEEGSMGAGTCAERSNFTPCPES